MLVWRKPSVIALGLGLLAFAAVTARPSHGFATPMLTLISSGGGVYDYGLTVGAGETVFNQGDTITLSGLSGITDASVTGSLAGASFRVSDFTPTSAVLAQSLPRNGVSGPATYGTFVVDSSVLTVGTVDFAIETRFDTFTGTVPGPVSAAIPEPASLSLFGAAVLGLGWFGRRRRQSA